MKGVQRPSMLIMKDNIYLHTNYYLTYALKDFSLALSITIFLNSLKAGSSTLKLKISFLLESVGGPVSGGCSHLPKNQS